MDKNDKTKDGKPATTEAQKGDEAQKNKFSASAKFSDSVVAVSNAADAIETLKQKVEEFENKYKRVLADYQNLEKRVVVERKEWILKSNKELLLRLLPILDTLILATKQSKDEGLTISLQQFLNVFKQEGVEKIETIGKNFDPNSMECIDTAEVDPSTGSGQEGKVIEELRAGYMLYDKVLRPAQVAVGKGLMSS
ncbi:MAG: nucleotide exchange factor GrpE [Patescibacteria group bacterium]